MFPALQKKIDSILYSDLKMRIVWYLYKKGPKPVTVNVQKPETEVESIFLTEPERFTPKPACGLTQTSPSQQEILVFLNEFQCVR